VPCPVNQSDAGDAFSPQLIRWRLNQIERLNLGDRLKALEENAKDIEGIKTAVEGIRSWLLRIVGGLVLALILLVINLAMAGLSVHQPQPNSHGVTQVP
jgi:hypothetical protein